MRRLWLCGLIVVAACGPSAGPEATTTTDGTTTSMPTTSTTSQEPTFTYPPAPAAPEGPLDETAASGVEALMTAVTAGRIDNAALDEIVGGGDVRAAWLFADLLRFYQSGEPSMGLVSAFRDLTGAEETPPGTVDFVWAFNHLIAWDLPDWDGYAEVKRRLYTLVDERWNPFFEEDHGVDWRLVTWGGVFADDRPLGDNGPCNCIPALDYPETTDADGGSWYPDDGIVFGVVVNGEPVALPKNQMEVHEMVNLTLGGRELGIPYCTLCGSAQAYLVDEVPGVDRVVLRTSGLLSRSNKVMYDLETGSMFDTFRGEALTGPLGEAGIILDQVSVVASRWGDWKQAHPDTRILAQDGGIGRTYLDDPLGGRDDSGPIFPVGDVDPRLPVQEKVVGVIAPDGTPVAFPVVTTSEALTIGDIEFQGVTARLSDGIRVFDGDGMELATHEAFWFAWSQFHPETLVWSP
jgi:hypothetical protein